MKHSKIHEFFCIITNIKKLVRLKEQIHFYLIRKNNYLFVQVENVFFTKHIVLY